MKAPIFLCAGETLWDVLPAGRFLGGAPFNVAAHAARLGVRAVLLTRVGDDASGQEARDCAVRLGIDTCLVQADATLPTGEARATLASDGSATYQFLDPCAWDALEADTAALDLAARADVVVYGTLVQRHPASRAALTRLLQVSRFRVYDPNLRAPHIDAHCALSCLHGAHLVKLNEDECVIFAGWLGCTATPEDLQQVMTGRFGVQSLCITRGDQGALLWHHDQWYREPAVPVIVADTVGAGDSFLAMLLVSLLAGVEPQRSLQRASALASRVASLPGAVPDYDAATFL